MKKYINLAISVNENDKKYAYTFKLPVSVNLVNLPKIPHVEIIQYCSTLKEAKETVTRWNAVYKANKEYLYDEYLK